MAGAPVVARTVSELHNEIRNAQRTLPRERVGARSGVGFVPTMGYLHAGHAALARRAREECEIVVASIFVNPLQFGVGEDFTSYPRDLAHDTAILGEEEADIVFVPEAAEMYPPGADTAVVVGAVALPLEGAKRPGHFRGVATVVAMLFNIVAPRVAYFGEKDWQQLQVVRHMVRDLHLPVRITSIPTVRESDGLALSSRNIRLSAEERVQALRIPAALEAARAAFADGERSRYQIEALMESLLSAEPGVTMDYAVVADPETLLPVDDIDRASRVLIAARVGKVRLIDNGALGG